MGKSLQQGEEIKLQGAQFDLSQLTIGLGWDAESNQPAELPVLHLGASRHHEEFDLDAIAVLLNAEGKIGDLGSHDGSGRATGDVVFHRAMRHASGAIWLTGDNRTGSGDGDDEQIVVKLEAMAEHYHKILFMVVIHDGKHRAQNFSRVGNAYIRAMDAKGEEVCRYDISANTLFAQACALVFAEVSRNGDGWSFRAIGQPQMSDKFTELLRPYM